MSNTLKQSDPDTLIRLTDLSAYIEDKAVLFKLNFDLKRGEIHSVLGTRMYDLTNFTNLFNGELETYNTVPEIFGKRTKFDVASKNGIAIIGQGISRFNGLSVVENIYLNRFSLVRTNKGREEIQCRKLMEKFGIDIDVKQNANLLSFEKQKMIEILRAYLNNQPINILYEPLLDISSTDREPILQIIQDMKMRGQGIVYVTSKLEDAFLLSDRISVLDEGTIKGTFNTQKAVLNPKEVLYLLSGWERIRQETNEKDLDVLNTIVAAREIMSSSNELKTEMTFLASDITKVFAANDCTIYIFNRILNNIAETFDKASSQSHIRLKNDVLYKMIQNANMVTLNPADEKFRGLFSNLDIPGSVVTVICMPVVMKGDISALIQIVYDREYEFTEKDRHYISAFSKEVAVAIETSQLIGRSTLLQESHHRIKNNLQMIINLVYMQKISARKNKDTNLDDAFDSIIRRISSIANIHNLLTSGRYTTSINSLSKNIREIIKFYDISGLQFKIDVDDMSIPYNKATSIALLVNELISNCTKHAFIRTKGNVIRISCHINGEYIQLEVADNGIGISRDFDITKTTSIGMSIIRSVVKGMNGKISFEVQNGTKVKIEIPLNEIFVDNVF